MSKQKEHLFEEKHFELYKRESEFWVRYFGLLDFDIQYKISEKNGSTLAATTVYHADKIATVEVTKLWDELNDQKIKEVAFHEVCEILLSRLRSMACGTFSEEAVNETCHSIIARLQNSIWRKSVGYNLSPADVNPTPLDVTNTTYQPVYNGEGLIVPPLIR